MIIEETAPGRIRIKAPAKLNLFLEVVRRRPDGYHDIETVMHAVDLCDEVTITKAERGIEFTCTGLDAGPDRDNLALLAAEAFARVVPGAAGARIGLVKKIPPGAGLGGGSSDAAAVLAGLNELNDRPLTRKVLADLGGTMGADIPFFFTGGTALCTGKGDRIEPVLSKVPYTFMLVYPGFPSLTGPVYQNLKLDLTKGKKDINVILDILRTHVVKGIHEVSFNRLQQAAFETTPKLEMVWRTLKDRGYGEFHLTGSGSSFFRMIDPGERDFPGAGEIEAGTSWRAFEVKSLHPP